MAEFPKVFDPIILDDGTSQAYHYRLDVTQNSTDESAGTVNVTATLRTWSTYNESLAFVWNGVSDYPKPVMGIYISGKLVANSNNSTFYLNYRKARDLDTAHKLTWTGNVNYISTGLPIKGIVNVPTNVKVTSIAGGAHTVEGVFPVIGQGGGDIPPEPVIPQSGSFNSSIIPTALWLIVKWQEGNINYTNKTSDVEVDVTIHHGGLIHPPKPCTISLGGVSVTINSPNINTTDYTSHLGKVTLAGIKHLDDGTFSGDLVVHWACDMTRYPSSIPNPKPIPYVEAKKGITLCTIPGGSTPQPEPEEEIIASNVILLYEAGTTDFSNNGLGSLKEALKCEVEEQLNDQFELTMTYPVFGRRFNDILLGRIILAKPNYYTQPQPFAIYNISKPINGIVTINAEHVSYLMRGYPVEPFTASTPKEILTEMNSKCVEPSPFSFETNIEETLSEPFVNLAPATQRSILGGGDYSVVNVTGGELEYDRYKVRLLKARGMSRGVTIRYSKNMTDFSQEENCVDVYSKIFPYYFRENNNAAPTYITIDGKTIDTGAKISYGKVLMLDLTQYFENTPTKAQLKQMAEAWLEINDISNSSVSMTVSFLQLAQSPEYKRYILLEKVLIGDTVQVVFPRLNVTADVRCIGTKYDCIAQKYISIDLGDPRKTFAETIRETK